MGCCSRQRKQVQFNADQKWDYINLQDFRATSCFTGFAYGYLWFSLLLSIAVYAVDTFTAVNLLAFDRWSSQIDPAIDFEVSKWIFSICIILSFINLGFEHFRAVKVMKRGNVAECYLDPLAIRLESIRLGKGQGWRRFLVFAELTKSKKGAEYIALFSYYSFQSWIRVLICSGPRQVVNAFTLWAVFTAKLNPQAPTVGGSFTKFFENIRQLAMEDSLQALILSGMLFTLVIWVFSFLFLLTAVFFWLVFLWHWIPRADGGLTGYCGRKVNKALTEIVKKKVDKAIEKQEQARRRAERHARNHGEKIPLERQATLPTLPDFGSESTDKLAEMPTVPTLQRSETMTTLPLYTSRPASPGSVDLGVMDSRRGAPTRTATMSSSTTTYSSQAPLIGAASEMGVSSIPPSSTRRGNSRDYQNNYPPPLRPGTSNSQQGFPRPRMNHMASNSNSSLNSPYTETRSSYGNESMPPFPAPIRSPTARTVDGYNPPPTGRSQYALASPVSRGPAADTFSDGRSSPAPSTYSSMSGTTLPRNPGPPNGYQPYQPYQPTRSATGPVPPRGPPGQQPLRSMTTPMPQRQQTGDYHSRQPPSQGSSRGFDYDMEAQRDRRY